MRCDVYQTALGSEISAKCCPLKTHTTHKITPSRCDRLFKWVCYFVLALQYSSANNSPLKLHHSHRLSNDIFHFHFPSPGHGPQMYSIAHSTLYKSYIYLSLFFISSTLVYPQEPEICVHKLSPFFDKF